MHDDKNSSKLINNKGKVIKMKQRERFNLTNGRVIEASLSLDDRRKVANIHFQVMTITNEEGYLIRTYTIYQDPSKNYQIGTFTRKTAKQLGLLKEAFTKELPDYLEIFCKQFDLELASA